MERLFLLFAAHFLGDFPFQSEWMVAFKGRDCKMPIKDANGTITSELLIARWPEVMFYHVAVYVSTMYVFMRASGYHPTVQGVLVDAVTHYVIDILKCRGIVKRIWLDQLCHLTVRTTLWYVGWL